MKRTTVQYWRRIVLGNAIAATLVLLVFSGITWTTPPSQLFRAYAISFLFATCIGPLLGALMPKLAPWIWQRARFPFNWIVVASAMAAVAIAGSAVAIAVLIAVGAVPRSEFLARLTGSARISIAITLTIGLVVTAYEMMRARVAQATAEAELASLEARVQPHFLFNTLNSIAALIHADPNGAERMTEQLASLMRSSLDQRTPTVCLEEELKTVRDYLAIEQVRFGDRLRSAIEVDPRAETASVPRLALQTLVENSVKFAVAPRRTGARIAVRASAQDGRVRIEVEDDGPGFDARQLPEGHGLALLRARLGLLYGDRASLQMDSRPGRTSALLTVPADTPEYQGQSMSSCGQHAVTRAPEGTA